MFGVENEFVKKKIRVDNASSVSSKTKKKKPNI
jgi:hypothetical protein